MDASIASLSPAAPNRRARRAGTAQQQALQQTLPMRARVAVGVSAPNWAWILGGAVLGALLLGPIGAIGGAAAGYLLLK